MSLYYRNSLAPRKSDGKKSCVCVFEMRLEGYTEVWRQRVHLENDLLGKCVSTASPGKRRAFEVQRFTRDEYERGDTTDWGFEVGWFQYANGQTWAWFSRHVDN